jgi:acyl carrier protein
MVFDKLVKVLAEHCEMETSKITMETTFEELGVDSLDTVEMLMN